MNTVVRLLLGAIAAVAIAVAAFIALNWTFVAVVGDAHNSVAIVTIAVLALCIGIGMIAVADRKRMSRPHSN